MSATPRTDEHLSRNLHSGGRSRPTIYELARQLERENTELRAALEEIAGNESEVNAVYADGIAIKALAKEVDQ